MGTYIYTADPAPLLITEQGWSVHLLNYASKPPLTGSSAFWLETAKSLSAAVKGWHERPGDCYLVIDHKGRQPLNGARVYQASRFSGACFDDSLGGEQYPEVGMFLNDKEGPLRFVSNKEQTVAWAATGQPWLSVDQCRARHRAGHPPTIDTSVPAGLLIARLYDAVHEHGGWKERAIRLTPGDDQGTDRDCGSC